MNDDSSKGMAKVVYILYLVSILIGVTSIVGVVIAYVKRSDAPEWLQTHYTYQIRTFWIGLLFAFIGSMLTMVLVGFLILLVLLIWLIVRAVKGLSALDKQEPIENYTRWGF